MSFIGGIWLILSPLDRVKRDISPFPVFMLTWSEPSCFHHSLILTDMTVVSCHPTLSEKLSQHISQKVKLLLFFPRLMFFFPPFPLALLYFCVSADLIKTPFLPHKKVTHNENCCNCFSHDQTKKKKGKCELKGNTCNKLDLKSLNYPLDVSSTIEIFPNS